MGLLSFFQRRNGPADANARLTDSPDAITAARTRARRRLMGAAVLLMAGVIGFPLVFETQPRPVPVDIPIDIPRKDGAPALSMPPARTPAARASSPIVASPRDDTAPAPVAEGPREVASPASAPAPKASAAEPAKKAVAEAKPAAAAVPVPAPPPAPDAARAKALLEGKEAAKPAAAAKPEPAREGGRFVVQVGAFADAAAAREMRGRVEKLGLKSYMQVVETSTGSRTRVRAGPFESRDEAEKALAKAKAAGLNAVVLTL
ncbi:SPOR domain-containing protein [Variovorax sp. YR752]|uniref:SPOR domain-containing protein n=1 Tax=Variovorax sp. YR752 TaxID=1884383 RepID=UPI0031382B26